MKDEARTPLSSPRKRGERISEAVWRIIELLLAEQLAEAEIRLREELATIEYASLHRQGRAIARVEQVFTGLAKRDAWPEDFSRGELIHWRGKIGVILAVVPLPRVIADLKATAAGKRNLLYYLSAEKGQRASRWEMLLCDVREEQWKEEKRQEAEDARRFFAGGEVDPPQAVEPDWVRRLKTERTMLEREADASPAPGRRREIEERIEQIRGILKARGFKEKDEG